MTEILKATHVHYGRTIVDPDSAGLRLPPFDDPDIEIASYYLTVVSPEGVDANYIDHPVCVSCPLYTREADVLKKSFKPVECLGPYSVSERIEQDGLYHMQGTIDVHEYAQGTIHGNCGVVVDTTRNIEEKAYIPERNS